MQTAIEFVVISKSNKQMDDALKERKDDGTFVNKFGITNMQGYHSFVDQKVGLGLGLRYTIA
jgi:hypothetical protein